MPVDNGAAYAVGNLIGANNQFAPNPMGGFYGGMLMNQQQGDNALNQDEQAIKNKQLQEALAQAQAQTPAVAAKAALEKQNAEQDAATGSKYGMEARAAATQDAIMQHYTSMNDQERKKVDQHLDDAERASDMIEAYGNGDAKAGMAFVQSNKKAQDHINKILSRNGSPGIDTEDPDGLAHVLAAGHAATASRKQRDVMAKQQLENAGKLADAQEHSRGAIEAAGIAANAVKTTGGVTARLQMEAQEAGGIQNLPTPKLEQLVAETKIETDKTPMTQSQALSDYKIDKIADPKERAKARDEWQKNRYGDLYMKGVEALRDRKEGGSGPGTPKPAAAAGGPNSGVSATQKTYLETMRKNNPGVSDDVLIKGLKDKGYW